MKADIIRNMFLRSRYLLLELAVPKSFGPVVPGQFLHIRVEESCDPFLRRPLSIHDVEIRKRGKTEKTIVKVLYEIVGKGTALLSEKRALTCLDILGPRGTGFDVKKISCADVVYIVAGGMGVAPLYFLAKTLRSIPGKKRGPKIVVLIGGRNKEHVMRDREFRDLGCEVYPATEDGSLGLKGRVTELLLEKLKTDKPGMKKIICACGPRPMLAVISDIARKASVLAYVSMEEFMGCGVGACLGCVIRTTFGYKRICHDGPVFESSEVIWPQ